MADLLSCSLLEGGELDCGGAIYVSKEHAENIIPPGSFLFWVFLLISGFFVLFAGMMSGLTIGLLSMDPMSLEVVIRSGTPKQKKYAKKVIALVKNQHLLLVTLLLSNAIAMEALPIFLDRISSPVAAIIISVTAVLLFGEVIPQALCKRFGLAIGANSYWLVRFLMVILFPISYPIAKVLDKLLGHSHLNRFKRTELAELVVMHGSNNQGPLSIDETTIILGALALKNKTAITCMTPLEQVYMVDMRTEVTMELIEEFKRKGHSRIPVYDSDKSNVKGILLVKSLLAYDFSQKRTVGELELRRMPAVFPSSDLYELLNSFQEGSSHMALIREPDTEIVVGVVTLEDIIEELIQEEILDEQDLGEGYLDRMRRSLERIRPSLDKKRLQDDTEIELKTFSSHSNSWRPADVYNDPSEIVRAPPPNESPKSPLLANASQED